MHVYMYTCIHVCMYVCMYVCVSGMVWHRLVSYATVRYGMVCNAMRCSEMHVLHVMHVMCLTYVAYVMSVKYIFVHVLFQRMYRIHACVNPYEHPSKLPKL